MPALFQAGQKVGHCVGMKVIEAELRQFLPVGLSGELQEEPHRVGVALDRVRPQSPLKLEVVSKERLQDGSERRCICIHRRPSLRLVSANAAKRTAAHSSSS